MRTFLAGGGGGGLAFLLPSDSAEYTISGLEYNCSGFLSAGVEFSTGVIPVILDLALVESESQSSPFVSNHGTWRKHFSANLKVNRCSCVGTSVPQILSAQVK